MTPEAACQPWSSKDVMNVAPYASPARLVSRGGVVRGNASHVQQPGITTWFRVPHRASARSIGHDQDRELPGHLFAVLERFPLDPVAAEDVDRRCEPRERKLAIEHVPHRRRKQTHAGALPSEHARRELVGQRGDDPKVA